MVYWLTQLNHKALLVNPRYLRVDDTQNIPGRESHQIPSESEEFGTNDER
jgi:hypothetical protein